MNFFKLLFIPLFLNFSLFSFDDFDFDGVEDIFDECPNTLITDLVDINGCTIESLEKSYDYDVIFGLTQSSVSYDASNSVDSTLSTMQLDYYHKNFSLQLSTAYLLSSGSSLLDTYLSGYYNFNANKDLSVRVGAALILPSSTIEGKNETDYMASANLSYKLETLNIFAGFSKTFINDVNSDETLIYKDASAYTLGLGLYPTKELYASLSYNVNESVYEGYSEQHTLSLYTFYTINKEWFTTINYDYGVDSALESSTLSLKVGYYF
jgi:hypothetical protein